MIYLCAYYRPDDIRKLDYKKIKAESPLHAAEMFFNYLYMFRETDYITVIGLETRSMFEFVWVDATLNIKCMTINEYCNSSIYEEIVQKCS